MYKVGIVMGSDSDIRQMAKAADILKEFDIGYEMVIISADREPGENAIPRRPISTGMRTPRWMSAAARTMPVATVAIDGAKNAGILAAQILSTASDEAAAEIREKLVAYKKDMRDGVKKKNDRLQEIGYEEYIKEK